MTDAWLEVGWPYNVVELLTSVASEREGVDVTVARPVLETDPTRTVSVYCQDWNPDENSHEMGGPSHGPTLSKYLYRMQALIKAGDQVEGHRTHALLSKSLRSMLYEDDDVIVGFGTLTETQDGVLERYQRHGVATQRFFSNEIGRTFVFLSTIDFWVQVEKA